MNETGGLAKRIARWVGGADEQPPARDGSFARMSEQRQQLYRDVGDFLFAHDLDLTPLNFSLAMDYLTGANPKIAAAVAERLATREPITDGWCERLIASLQTPDLTADTLSSMIDKIEENLDDVSGLIDRSRSSAADYGNALAGAAEEIPAASAGAAGLVKLINLTEGMIRETRDVEQELRRQQGQVQLLEKNLATARHAAEHDHLTGLPNRRAFESRLTEEAAAAKRSQEPLVVVFCDIDHFKAVNDEHGHEAGDRVLKYVGEMLSEISDERCHVARHGGEEFVMLFRRREMEEVFEIVDEARSTLFKRTLINKETNKPMPNVSFSAGIADVHAYPDPRSALKAADQALYLAKKFGRNQVRIAAD